mmetsp:Transcript_29625/g.75984  ORF Transcript_29625/g.75984 Transcript_29625/m.75984 type:complete len:133 (+) Transcript_29625:120-518(+)
MGQKHALSTPRMRTAVAGAVLLLIAVRQMMTLAFVFVGMVFSIGARWLMSTMFTSGDEGEEEGEERRKLGKQEVARNVVDASLGNLKKGNKLKSATRVAKLSAFDTRLVVTHGLAGCIAHLVVQVALDVNRR